MKTTTFLTKSVSAVVLVMLVMAPVSSRAAAYDSSLFNSFTVQEKIVFLLGMVAQLQITLDYRNDSGNTSSGRDRSDIDVDTKSATDIEDDEAELRAEIDLNGEDEALVWFEYGEDDDDLDDRTSKQTVTDSRGDVRDIDITVDDLDGDERYYFRAVAEDENGDRSYGSVRNFTTDDRNGGSSSSGDFEIDVSDTSIDAGDEVSVDWEIPDDETGTQNWIGLYEVGEDNEDYVKWVYIDNDESGTEYFTIDDDGDFEFRLFLDNSFDDEVTSDEIESVKGTPFIRQ